MVSKKGGEALARVISMAPSLSEALIYATMCIVGLPVEVQVKDGSLYSGILHTACFDKDHGIVLKKARKIGKEKCHTNLALGDFVDTLIVLSDDLVQVVVKGLLLPTEGTVGHFPGKTAEAVNQVESPTCSDDVEREGKGSTCENNFTTSRQVTGCTLEGEKHDDPIEEVVHEVHHLGPNTNANGARCSGPASLSVHLVSPKSEALLSVNFSVPGAKTSTCSTSTNLASDSTVPSCPSRSASSDATIPKMNKAVVKESKLNPSAKVFTPSVANCRQVSTAVPSFVSPTQMSNNLPMMPIAGAQLGTEMTSLASHFPIPSKLVLYNSVLAAHAGIGTTRPVMGHASIRQPPVRINGQYHPLQAGHLYLNPHSQMVTVGQLSQPVYVHPASQDVIQGAPVMSQGQPHPLLSRANAPKFQGTTTQSMQLSMTPPIMADGNQTVVVPTHVPFSQSFAVAQPIMIPGGNAHLFH